MAANKNRSIFRTTNRSRAGECRHEPTHVLAICSLFRKRSWLTARHLCTSENSVDNFYIFFYQPPNYLRVYSVVFLYPSAVRWVSLSFSVVWCGLVPSLVSQSQSPKSGISKPEPLPPFGLPLGLPLLLCGVVWSCPQSGIAKPEPQVWYRKARTPPTRWSAAGSPSPSPWCGVAGCPSRSTRQLPTRTGAVDWRPA